MKKYLTTWRALAAHPGPLEFDPLAQEGRIGSGLRRIDYRLRLRDRKLVAGQMGYKLVGTNYALSLIKMLERKSSSEVAYLEKEKIMNLSFQLSPLEMTGYALLVVVAIVGVALLGYMTIVSMRSRIKK